MEDDAEESQGGRRMPLHREIAYWLFASLVVLGVLFYFWWGFAFRVWIDNGVYAVVVTLVLFGLAGMWLVAPDPPAAPAPVPKT
jgi:type VI protein secretion system component VasF